MPGVGQAREVSSSTSALPRALRPFGGGQYRLLAAGLMFALFSDGVWTITLVWQVIGLGGGPGQVSLATGLAAVGMVISTLAGGVLADRVSQRSIIIGLEIVKMAVFAIVAFCAIGGVLTMPIVAAAAVFGGITTGMYYQAYSALLPGIVAADELQAANGIEGIVRPVLFQAAGPMIAGAVIAAAAPAQAALVAAVASVGSALCYLRMRPVPLRRDPNTLRGPAIASIVTDLAEGFAYMWRTPWLWSTLFFATILVLATMGPIEVLIPFALRERVHGGAGDHSLVLAAFGAGAAISSLVFASIPMPRRYLTLMFRVVGLVVDSVGAHGRCRTHLGVHHRRIHHGGVVRRADGVVGHAVTASRPAWAVGPGGQSGLLRLGGADAGVDGVGGPGQSRDRTHRDVRGVWAGAGTVRCGLLRRGQAVA